MEAYEKKMKELKNQDDQKQELPFSFKPPTPKVVPDFKRLHKQFAYKLERNKSASKLTVPSPFNFHQPKNMADQKKHMDQDNQFIRPTKKRARSARTLNRDIFEKPLCNPPSTKKHEAMVALRRTQQTKKLEDKIVKQNEEQVREIK